MDIELKYELCDIVKEEGYGQPVIEVKRELDSSYFDSREFIKEEPDLKQDFDDVPLLIKKEEEEEDDANDIPLIIKKEEEDDENDIYWDKSPINENSSEDDFSLIDLINSSYVSYESCDTPSVDSSQLLEYTCHHCCYSSKWKQKLRSHIITHHLTEVNNVQNERDLVAVHNGLDGQDELNVVGSNKSQVSVVENLSSNVEERTSRISVKNACKYSKKKHWCVICRQLKSQIMRHMQKTHSDLKEITEYAQISDKNEKREIAYKLITKWDSDFNKENPSQIIERKKVLKGNQMPRVECPHCHSVVSNLGIVPHLRKCSYSNNNGRKIREELNVESLLSRNLEEEMKMLILPKLKTGKVKECILEDELILKHGNNMCNALKGEGKETPIRNHLRIISKIVLAMKEKDETIKNSAHLFNPVKYDLFADTIKTLCGAGKGPDKKYKSPIGPRYYGKKIRLLSDDLSLSLTHLKRNDLLTEVEAWQKLYDEEFDKLVGLLGRKKAQRRRAGTKNVVPKIEDVMSLLNFINTQLEESCKYLQTIGFCSKCYDDLLKCMLLKMWIFNRMRVGEVHKILLCNWNDATEIDEGTIECQALTKSEQLCAFHFKRLLVKAKMMHVVGVLIPKKDIDKMNLMISLRKDANISESNPYLFACDHSFLEGTAVMREYAIRCGVKDPELLTGNNLRRQMATSLRYLDLSEEDLGLISSSLGHSLQTHLLHYRKHNSALHAGRASKIFMALDQGLLHLFKDKTQDEIEMVMGDNLVEMDEEDEVDPQNQNIATSPLLSPPRVDVLQHKTSLCPSTYGSQCQKNNLETTPVNTRKRKISKLEASSRFESCETSSEEPGMTLRRRRSSQRRIMWTKQMKALISIEFAEHMRLNKIPSMSVIVEKLELLKSRLPVLKSKSAAAIKTMISNMIRNSE